MTDPADSRCGRIYCLFNTGEAYRVHADIIELDHPGGEAGGHVLQDGSSDFNSSARRAAKKLFNSLYKREAVTRPFIASFDLDTKNDTSLLNITGRSAELCFALAAAAKIFKFDGFNLAATGLIRADDTIGPVNQDEIAAKFEAALAMLPENGMIFYPKENMIPPEIRPVLKQKNIHPVAVSSLEQALDILLHSSMEADRIERRHTGIGEENEPAEGESAEPSRNTSDPRPAISGRTIVTASVLIFLTVLTLCVLFFMSQTPRTDRTTPTAEQQPIEIQTKTTANKPAKADSKESSNGKDASFETKDLTDSRAPERQNPSPTAPEQNNSSAEKEKKKDKDMILDQGFE